MHIINIIIINLSIHIILSNYEMTVNDEVSSEITNWQLGKETINSIIDLIWLF